jgi:glycosyltransferase involved in cell wall biosynthesis
MKNFATLVSKGRFHHFHLARQLEKHELLDRIFTGYPRFKLRDEAGIDPKKIISFPWIQAPYMARSLAFLDRFPRLDREWAWLASESLDSFVARSLHEPTILIALSGCGLHAGRKVKCMGGIHICDRGSSHIRVQDKLLAAEYQRYGSQWSGIDPRVIAKEEAEYAQANWISVPSQFCYDTFVEQGVPSSKLLKFPYGSRLERFYPDSSVCDLNLDEFRVLFVGCAGPRKGFIDLLRAFKMFRHPRKRLILIGSLTSDAKQLLNEYDQAQIRVLGSLPNSDLRRYYSQSSVFVLPSIEEGLAMVIGEAMACGCPIIATTNTGAADVITDGVEGFIVPIHSPNIIANCLQKLADAPQLRSNMAKAALQAVHKLRGWDSYGFSWSSFLNGLR